MSSKESKIRLSVQYDGTNYKGWQKQLHAPTIQDSLEKALRQYFCWQDIHCVASGRTDAGAHAKAQNVHFTVPTEILKKRAPFAPRSQDHSFDFIRSLNRILPPDIKICKAWKAPLDFHVRNSCQKKTYCYYILNAPYEDPFLNRYSLHVENPISLKKLQNFCPYLLGTYDFKSFQTQGTPILNTVRSIFKVEWRLHSPQILIFEIQGSGFLKQMVRNIIGTMLHLEKQGRPAKELKKILNYKDRQKAHGTAPAKGLFLEKVHYGTSLDRKCLKI